MFGTQMLLGSALVVASVIFHVAALVVLARILTRSANSFQRAAGVRQLVTILAVEMLVIIAIHTIEAWVWAVVYIALGEFSDLQQSLYFSVVTSTTLGYGDITLSPRWQLLGTFEAMGGLVLFGASTAFIIASMRRLFEGSNLNNASN